MRGQVCLWRLHHHLTCKALSLKAGLGVSRLRRMHLLQARLPCRSANFLDCIVRQKQRLPAVELEGCTGGSCQEKEGMLA